VRPRVGRGVPVVLTAAVLLTAVPLVAACSSGGDRDRSADRAVTTDRPATTDRRAAADRRATATTPSGGAPVTVLGATTVAAARDGGVSTTVPQDCGPLRAADVASALGLAEGEVRRGRADAPDEPCVFRAGAFEVATASAVQEPTDRKSVV
jgi:hypothetical protein